MYSSLRVYFLISFIFSGLLYCMHRRNVKLQDEEVKKSKLKQIIEPESGNSEVLLMNGKCWMEIIISAEQKNQRTKQIVSPSSN